MQILKNYGHLGSWLGSWDPEGLSSTIMPIGTFRFDYEYEIEYEYDFSNVLCVV